MTAGEGTRAEADAADLGEGAPRKIGPYHVLRPIGRGGMGEVYAAYDERLDRKVALKVLREGTTSAEARARLLREAQALARLTHPAVVTVHDVGVSDGAVYLAMEFITGVTLREWLGERPREPAAILAAFIEAGRGLAAAHAVGIVHRDFKPDNVMVDTAGRVHVYDFGLARPIGEAPPSPLVRDPTAEPTGDVTLTGTILGTPAYMSPEQHLGRPVDARTDVFAFCVALYEALCGQRPFPGVGSAEIAAAVVRAEHRPPPRGALPAWLHRVLLHGLHVEPERRWASMDALLDALRADPSARRRRAAAIAVAAALIPALVVLVVVAGLRLRERWNQERAESAASARWQLTQARIDALQAAGRDADADAAFGAFVGADEHRGTRILSDAWYRRGERELAQGDPTAAAAAFAHAYTSAIDPAHEAEALTALARLFRARGAWSALASALQALAELDATTTPERRALAAELAILDRDLARARTLLVDLGDAAPPDLRDAAPILAGLASATPLGYAAVHATFADVEPGGPAELVLIAPDGRTVLVLDHRLALLAEHRLPGGLGRARLLPSAPLVLAHAEGHLALFQLRGRLTELWRGEAATWPFAAAAADLDRDGDDEIYVGLAAYRRGLHRLRLADLPSAPLVVADPAIDASASDVEAILPVDLDGDGHHELVVAVGPWDAYDLRVLRQGDNGALTHIDRRELGHARALAALRDPDGGLLLAAAVDHYVPSRVVFPEPPHAGAPPGLHLFRWQDGHLVPAAHLPPSLAEGPFRYLDTLLAADVDGDGLLDLLVTEDRPGTAPRRLLVLYRQRPDGTFARITVGGLTLLAARPRQGAPGSALVVSEGQRLWLLGEGKDPLPAALPEPSAPEPPPPALEPALAQRWRRAARLEAAGLPRLAADNLRAAALIAESQEASRLALARAAELLAGDGDDVGAVELFAQVAVDPALAARTRRSAARSYVRLGRYDDALAALERGQDDPSPPQPGDLDLPDLRRLTDPREIVELRFDRPLDPAWEVQDPLGFARSPVDRHLRLRPGADPRPLARLPLVWDGGPLVLDLDLAVLHPEFAGQLLFALVDERGDELAAIGLAVRGGGQIYSLDVLCANRGPDRHNLLGALPFVDTATASPLPLRLTVLPARDLAICRAPGVGALRAAPRGPLPPGRYALELRSDRDDAFPTHLELALRALTIRGAHLAEPLAASPSPSHSDPADPTGRASPPSELASHSAPDPADPTGRAAGATPGLADLAWALAEGRLDRLAGPARPDEPARAALWRAVAADAQHDPERAAAALARALADPTLRRLDLLALVRDQRLTPALRAALGDAFFDLLADAWGDVVHHHPVDPRVARAFLDATAILDLHPDRDPHRERRQPGDPNPVTRRPRPSDHRAAGPALEPAQGSALPARTAVAALLHRRGRLWLDLGELDRAEPDLLRALALAEALPDPPLGLALALHRDLAALALARRQPGRARDHLRRAADLAPAPLPALDRLRRHPDLAPL